MTKIDILSGIVRTVIRGFGRRGPNLVVPEFYGLRPCGTLGGLKRTRPSSHCSNVEELFLL